METPEEELARLIAEQAADDTDVIAGEALPVHYPSPQPWDDPTFDAACGD